MAAPSLRHGDLVWGKLGRYPPWPGKIVNPPKDLKKPRGKKCLFVKFFGTEDHAWIKVEQLKPYHPHKEEMIKANKGKRFQVAVDAVEEFLKKAKAKEQSSSDDKSKASGKKSEGKKADGKKSEGKKSEGKKTEGKKSEGKTKKPTGERKRKSSETATHSSSKKPRDQSPRKRGRPPKDKEEKQFTRGRYDLSTPAAQNTVVRRVQAILRTEYRRVLTPKQVQVMWSDLKRRDQDLLKPVVAEMRSGNAPPQPRDPQPHRAARAARASSRSSSPEPSHHSEQVARRQAGSLQYVSLSSHLKVRREMRRMRQRLRRQERGVPTRDFKILQQQVLELRERSARQEEEIAQLKGTGGRRDA